MKVTFAGTRGSIPTVTKETHKYGGNTPCVMVNDDKHVLILDAGSGIRALNEAGVLDQFDKIHILLTHLHMDHIQGLGFFIPFFVSGRKVNIWGPSGTSHLVERLARYLSPPLFPVRIRDFKCDLGVLDIPMKPFEIGAFNIHATYICHPGPTLGFRIEHNGKVLAYIPDHEPALANRDFPGDPKWTSGYELARDADLLIHDAQFSDHEYNHRRGWGHSSYSHVLGFAGLANARKLALFHHDPSHDDARLEEMYTEYHCADQDFEVFISREGMEITL